MSQTTSSSAGASESVWPAPIQEIRQLIRDRKITKDLFETPEFQSLWHDVPACLESNRAEVVWASLSTLGRLAAVSKPAERLAQPLISERLGSSLPDMIRLADGEDRYYLAKSMELGDNTRTADLAFRELAEEETAETARRVWAGIAAHTAKSLAEFLRSLNQQIDLVRNDQNLNPDVVCRRLRRINAAVEDFLAAADCDAGEDLGQHMRKFYCGHVPSSGPEDRDLRDDTSSEFLASLKKIVRLNYSARTDPETYKVVASLRNWWGRASPSQMFENSARQIVRLGVESVLSFVKQGVMNKPLRKALVEASNEKTVEALARDFAVDSHAIDSNVAYWFIHGTEPKDTRSVGAVAAISETKLDEYIARLLIALDMPEFRGNVLEQALSDVTDIMPSEGGILSAAFRRVAQIGQWARAVARARQVELSPLRTETVSFDPKSHAGSDNIKVGATVLVSTAGATKKVQGDVKVVLVKAEVEPDRG